MNYFKSIVVGIPLFLSLSFVSSTMNCDLESAKSRCLKNLDQGFAYLKSYELYKVEEDHSFIFSKGVNYMLISASVQATESKIEIRLLDKNRKLLFSNYNKKKDQYFKVIYPCTYTGIHYIQFVNHEGKNKTCGAGLLAFKRER